MTVFNTIQIPSTNRNNNNHIPYFSDYKMHPHFSPKFGGKSASYSPNVAYLLGGAGGWVAEVEQNFFFLFSSSKT